MGGQGLRVLAFAARVIADDEVETMIADPMAFTHDLVFVGMVGMIDPLRREAKAAVATALGAGIDVRMITGDNPVTARGDRHVAWAWTGRDQRQRAAGPRRSRARAPPARAVTAGVV